MVRIKRKTNKKVQMKMRVRQKKENTRRERMESMVMNIMTKKRTNMERTIMMKRSPRMRMITIRKRRMRMKDLARSRTQNLPNLVTRNARKRQIRIKLIRFLQLQSLRQLRLRASIRKEQTLNQKLISPDQTPQQTEDNKSHHHKLSPINKSKQRISKSNL